jgi:hypothetical protein
MFIATTPLKLVSGSRHRGLDKPISDAWNPVVVSAKSPTAAKIAVRFGS